MISLSRWLLKLTDMISTKERKNKLNEIDQEIGT